MRSFVMDSTLFSLYRRHGESNYVKPHHKAPSVTVKITEPITLPQCAFSLPRKRYASCAASLPTGSVFLLSRDLFCCIDFEGTLLKVNPAFEALVGRSSEQLLGRACGVVVNPLDHPVIESALARMHKGEKVSPFEVRAVSTTGKQHWLEVTASFGDGVIYVIARVISRRKAVEEQLLRNQRLFQIAGETALIGGWYVDMADGLPIWSDELCQIHGMPPGFQPSVEEAFAFYAPGSRESLREAFVACCEHGIGFDGEFEVITRQGKHLWVRAIGKAVRDEEGNIIQVQGASQDITEQKQLRENLTQLAHRLTMTLDSITD